MFLFFRIIRTLFILPLFIILTLLTVITVILYSTKATLTDREFVKQTIRSDEIHQLLIDQLNQTVQEENGVELSEDVEEQIVSEVSNVLTEEETSALIDERIDSIYDWIEGKSDHPFFADSVDGVSGDALGIEKLIGNRLGESDRFIDYAAVNQAIYEKFGGDEFKNSEAGSIPQVYQRIDKGLDYLIIANLVVGGLLLLSAGSLRNGLAYLGVSVLISSIIIIKMPSIIESPTLHTQLARINGFDLEKIKNLPPLALHIAELLWVEIHQLARQIGIYLAIGSTASIVTSQLAIKVRTIEIEEVEGPVREKVIIKEREPTPATQQNNKPPVV